MDLTFNTPKGRFNYRVGAVIIHNGKLLAVKNACSSYYYSVGGRVKLDETCEEAVKREVKEELGVALEIDRPLFFCENFFDEKETGEHFHEVSVYYLMKINDETDKINCRSVTDKGEKESLFWLPIKELDNYTLYPSFLKKELAKLTDNVKFIVERES